MWHPGRVMVIQVLELVSMPAFCRILSMFLNCLHFDPEFWFPSFSDAGCSPSFSWKEHQGLQMIFKISSWNTPRVHKTILQSKIDFNWHRFSFLPINYNGNPFSMTSKIDFRLQKMFCEHGAWLSAECVLTLTMLKNKMFSSMFYKWKL